MQDIAPHEGEEWRLVLEGTKPFAVVELSKGPDQYNYVKRHNGSLYTAIFVESEEGPEVRFWKKGNEQGRLNNLKYYQLVNNSQVFIKYFGNHWYQREMGILFGYTEEQIEAFISGDLKCNCTKCKGVSHGK